MKKQQKVTKVEIISKDGRLGGYKITPTDTGAFIVPVYYAMYGDRNIINHIEKGLNIQKGSKYMKPSTSAMGRSYQVSGKEFRF